MKKDINISMKEISNYRVRIAELESQVDNLTQKNEYLNKLVQKYREMIPEVKPKEDISSIKRHGHKVSKAIFLPQNSIESSECGVLDSKDMLSSPSLKPLPLAHTRSESTAKMHSSPLHLLENLHSLMTQFETVDSLYKCLEIQGNLPQLTKSS